MTRYVDHAADGTPLGRCIVLPGRQYTPDGPMLFFAAQVALMRGWDVRQVCWEVPQFDSEAEEVAWVGSELDAALDGYAGRVLVVAKSLGSLAAPPLLRAAMTPRGSRRSSPSLMPPSRSCPTPLRSSS